MLASRENSDKKIWTITMVSFVFLNNIEVIWEIILM